VQGNPVGFQTRLSNYLTSNAWMYPACPLFTYPIQVPRLAAYLGAERWDLYDVADCELHLFVEAYPDKTVKAMYWIQFEAYLPTNEHTYDYSRAPSGRPSNENWSNAR
jgi:hypothetical protein